MVSYYIWSFKWSLITGDLLNDLLLQMSFKLSLNTGDLLNGFLLQVSFK